MAKRCSTCYKMAYFQGRYYMCRYKKWNTLYCYFHHRVVAGIWDITFLYCFIYMVSYMTMSSRISWDFLSNVRSPSTGNTIECRIPRYPAGSSTSPMCCYNFPNIPQHSSPVMHYVQFLHVYPSCESQQPFRKQRTEM